MNYFLLLDKEHLDDYIINELDEDKFLEWLQIDNFVFQTDNWFVPGASEQIKYRSFKEICRKLASPKENEIEDFKKHLNYDTLYKFIEKYRLLIE
jgi:hypothetical protein